MHKIIYFAIYLIAIYANIMPATAQNGTQLSTEQARKQIRQEKTEIESSYKEKEAACLKRFVATPCIDDAKLQKTKALAQIKQRELVLNDEERALKKAKIESKLTQSPKADSQSQSKQKSKAQQEMKSSDSLRNTDESADDAQKQKQQQKQSQAQAQAKLRVEKTEMKKVESDKKANRRSAKSNQESTNAAKFQNKIAEAQARKSAVEERNSNRSKPKSAPLPSPSTAKSESKSSTPR